MSDDLIVRARSRDEAALRTLYERHRSDVLRLAYGVLGDRDEAEDVMQDVLVYALTHLDRYDAGRGAFGTWLYTMTVNRCRDRLRRRRLQQRVLGWIGRTAPWEAPDAASDIGRLDTERGMRRALASLTELQREALVLREVEGMSFAELGDVLGVPLRTAQARVNSAVSALRRAWQSGDAAAGAAATKPESRETR